MRKLHDKPRRKADEKRPHIKGDYATSLQTPVKILVLIFPKC